MLLEMEAAMSLRMTATKVLAKHRQKAFMILTAVTKKDASGKRQKVTNQSWLARMDQTAPTRSKRH